MGRKRKGGLVPVMEVPSSSYVLESGAPPVAFRLGGSSAKLAKLVEHYSRERGERVSKSEVMRMVIHKAYRDVFGGGQVMSEDELRELLEEVAAAMLPFADQEGSIPLGRSPDASWPIYSAKVLDIRRIYDAREDVEIALAKLREAK